MFEGKRGIARRLIRNRRFWNGFIVGLLLMVQIPIHNPFCVYDKMECVVADRVNNIELTFAFKFIDMAERGGLVNLALPGKNGGGIRLDEQEGYRRIVERWTPEEIAELRRAAVRLNKVAYTVSVNAGPEFGDIAFAALSRFADQVNNDETGTE